MSTPCERISATIGELFSCSPVEGATRIRTPYLYPDGDVIDLFLRERSGEATLTDYGETLRWLRMQSLSQKRSPKQRKLIEDVCVNHGVELFRGMLMARVRDESELAASLTRLAQASLRVADLWFTFRTRSVENVADEVEDFFVDRDIPFQRGAEIPGRSGRIWRPDFHTRHPRRSSLVYVLSTGSRGAARGIAEHVLASWYDLSHLKVGPESLQFVSLFDDTMDVWTLEDFRLVEDLSDVCRWSRPDEFALKLIA